MDPRCLAASLVVVSLSACVGPELDELDQYDVSEGELVASRDYNNPERHNDQCVRPRRGLTLIPLRYADFSPTGYTLAASQLTHPADSPCPDGTLQLDPHEALATTQGRLYFHRGGHGYDNAGDTKYGFVWLYDLAESPPVVPASDTNGDRAPLAQPSLRGPFRVSVRSIPPVMRYWKTDRSDTISYVGYGNPAWDQGAVARRDLAPYTYMVWSWMNTRGGGMVRAVVRDGATFERSDVRSIRMDSVDASGRVNGWVQAVYGRVHTTPGAALYGWMTYAHQHTRDEPGYPADRAPVFHLTR